MVILILIIIIILLTIIAIFLALRIKKWTSEYSNLKKIKSLILELQEQKETILRDADAAALQAQNAIKTSTATAAAQYIATIEQDYRKAEHDYQNYLEDINKKKEQADEELQTQLDEIIQLKNSINIATKTYLEKQEAEEELNFHKLSITDSELFDIQQLENLKPVLHNPVVISKIIWSNFFQKQTTELCNRILGPCKVCGIYKITDLITHQCYIGQSVDTATRLKNHIKCGLGIDPPSNNKLYKQMQKDKVWNFTFELLEKCEQNKLDEREAFWIDIYEANIFGLNATIGNTKKIEG